MANAGPLKAHKLPLIQHLQTYTHKEKVIIQIKKQPGKWILISWNTIDTLIARQIVKPSYYYD